MNSAIYLGKLRHRRFTPVAHEFIYPLFMVLLDIDHIPKLMKVSRFSSYNRFNWASFDDRDHFGDARCSLRERLHADAQSHGLNLPDGPIYLLTHLRYLGYNFNPISLFYCCDTSGNIQSVLAEVNNTFGESHNYWLSAANQKPAANSLCYSVPKALHVSPFMKMDLGYNFTLTAPSKQLLAHMDVLDGSQKMFDATLQLQREPWSAPALHSALLRHPWMTAKVIAAIHWEALKLYLRKVPVFTKPESTIVSNAPLRQEGDATVVEVAHS